MSPCPPPCRDSYMVRVKAVVMTRDESSGGWLAQDGCLSRVSVCRLLPGGQPGRYVFFIYAERLTDRQVILECFLKKDLVYTKATPTFHHWKVDNRKCGLTFQSPADARAFDRGVRRALEDLTEGPDASVLHLESVCVCLVVEPGDHRCRMFEAFLPYFEGVLSVFVQVVHMFPRHVSFQVAEPEIVRINGRERAWLTGYEDYRHAGSTRHKVATPLDPDTRLPTKHECGCLYPLGRDGKPRRPRKADGSRSLCVYCQNVFEHEENGRGRCQEAPDPVQTCIRRVSFLWCADSLLYHCMSDPEGDFSDPCSCDTGDERFCLRWAALLALSLLAPCMCCYAPLRACHRCGVACRCCGGKHKAAA
uniref:Sprouty-related, EVH1 domain-containing protein 2 n=1 Tax=Salarias fasciatus TaxID=181472 RepID=A0A672I4A3_SALFA